tara:strand:- start:1102 stop:2976 length:1875 start_codon:yes stop_codon:yes gene_type:complete
MAGYSRTDTTNNIADGNIINASDFDGEFDAIATAFGTSGHTHDGTSENGGAITKIGPAQDLVVSASLVTPKTTNTLDIGTDALEFKDIYIDGIAYIDGLGRDMLVASDKKIEFRDDAIFINSSTNGQLDIDADVTVQINTATLDIDASSSVNISGATTIGGVITATTGTHSLGATSFNDNAITNVGDIQLDSITGDDDTDTSITFSGSNIITIATGGSNRLTIADGALSPVTTNQIDLGTSSLEYKNAFFDGTVTTDALVADTADIDAGTIDGVTLGTNSAITQAVIDNVNINGAQIGHTDDTDLVTLADQAVTIAGSLTLSGGLTVNGTTTTVATTNTVATDSLIELANGTSGSPANDAGIVIERGSANNAFMGFDESADKFIVGTGTFTGASTGDLTITTGTLVANLEGNVTGDTTGTNIGTLKKTASDTAFTLPASDGSANEFLKTDGSGNLGFSAVTVNNSGFDASGSEQLTVSKGGTGATSFTNNRVLTGNGTSAIVDEANLTFDGSTLSVTGGVTATGTVQGLEVTATSDERLKSDIQTIDNALDKVMKMRGVTYTMQDQKGTGVVAQEIEKILPEVVVDNEYKSVAYGNIVGVLIEAIKDLKKEIDEHKQGCKCHGS